MKSNEVKNLSDNELRIKVAELIGYVDIVKSDTNCYGEAWDGYEGALHGLPRDIPDYCHDLNAMHEAERCLGVDNIGIYEMHLSNIAGGGYGIAVCWGATARQRAEAFILTMDTNEIEK